MTTTPTTRASLLMKLCDPRDHEAWVEFVSLYEPVIYRILRRSGLQDADALEVMQDFLLAVSRSIDRWEPGPERGSFRGWLRRVVKNLVINWVQRKKRCIATTSLELDSLVIAEPVGVEETGEFDAELRRSLFQQAAEQVRQEIRTQTWQAFFATSIKGQEVAEVAAKLGMSVGAVRVAKCRVIARLREVIERSEEDP